MWKLCNILNLCSWRFTEKQSHSFIVCFLWLLSQQTAVRQSLWQRLYMVLSSLGIAATCIAHCSFNSDLSSESHTLCWTATLCFLTLMESHHGKRKCDLWMSCIKAQWSVNYFVIKVYDTALWFLAITL